MRGFATYHPFLVLMFFLGALVLSIIVVNPVVQAVGLACAAWYYLLVVGAKGWKTLAALLPIAFAIALINPLFQSQGETSLFLLPWGRPYTLQALAYGASTALMFVAALLWFFSFNHVMTSDRLMHVFGRLAPAITLVLTMALRLVPSYQRKAAEIRDAQACLRKRGDESTLRARARSGISVLSSLLTWALEGSITTADSMRARGFGSTRRTSFMRYPLTLRDAMVSVLLGVLFASACVAFAMGAASMEFFPALAFSSITPLGIIGVMAYVCFLTVPSCIHVQESISWSISLSKI